MRRQFLASSAISLLLVSSSAFCKNVYVVGEVGKPRNIEEYVEQTQKTKLPAPFTSSDVQEALNATYPLETNIPLRAFPTYKIDISLPYNIAVVGVDRVSKTWLQQNYKKLVTNSVVVLVIEAKNITEYSSFERTLNHSGLRVAKVSGAMFEHILKGYPALIVNGEVSQ
ncbi:hypothetical protein KUL42_38810 [Alteromonas sp. KUL42]|uniref:DUF2859 domain-containing protein n=1 Tax=Alteromonas sp. KUL42 TaxID=2480797 RepID=UPI00103614A4|nr:DUF2859 domain-containing protein [Alteromonas sp. KUL42]TAP31688.1 DUF2859 domain-containing protein [Alteromonas sp. KUL42]GEA09120.1 hypothetical protein KUL42_38810 [Alteromonas sp. KUL42]